MGILSGHQERVDFDNRYGNTELQQAVNDMLERFRRADCVIQAVDIGGLRAGADISESTHTTGQDSLFYMANETGGELFKESVIVNDEVLKGIEDCIDLAPLHNPNNLRGIRAVREIFGQATPQVAVFDTAFHTSIPEYA